MASRYHSIDPTDKSQLPGYNYDYDVKQNDLQQIVQTLRLPEHLARHEELQQARRYYMRLVNRKLHEMEELWPCIPDILMSYAIPMGYTGFTIRVRNQVFAKAILQRLNVHLNKAKLIHINSVFFSIAAEVACVGETGWQIAIDSMRYQSHIAGYNDKYHKKEPGMSVHDHWLKYNHPVRLPLFVIQRMYIRRQIMQLFGLKHAWENVFPYGVNDIILLCMHGYIDRTIEHAFEDLIQDKINDEPEQLSTQQSALNNYIYSPETYGLI